MVIVTVKPLAVRVYTPSVGVKAPSNAEVEVVLELPDAYPDRVVVIVATAETPADKPETVTRPVLEIETVAPLVALPAHVYWLL